MADKESWKSKLTPFDAELFVMVESLTEKPCDAKNGGNHFYFEADYEKHNDPQYIFAIWDAIEGRVGKRMISIKDDPERHVLVVRVRFSQEDYPMVIGDERETFEPDISVATRYTTESGSFRAIRVEKKNADILRKFVGGGQVRIPRDESKPVSFHFLNGDTFLDAKEGDFVCRFLDNKKNVKYIVMSESEFEMNF